jgi:hypothetical protein
MFILFLLSVVVLVAFVLVVGFALVAGKMWDRLGADLTLGDFMFAVANPTLFIRAWKNRAK